MLESKTGTLISELAKDAIHNMNFFYDIKNNTTIETILEIRLIIEPQLAFYAAQRCDIECINRLKEVSENLRLNQSHFDDFNFHTTIDECSKNSLCKDMIISLLNQLRASKYSEFNSFPNTVNNLSAKLKHD